MTSAFRPLTLAILLLIIPSVILNASNHPGLKCPTDAKGGKRASVKTTHIRKKLVKQKHDALKQAKVKIPKVHKKIAVKLPHVDLPEIKLPKIHIDLPEIHIRNPFHGKTHVVFSQGKHSNKGRHVLSTF